MTNHNNRPEQEKPAVQWHHPNVNPPVPDAEKERKTGISMTNHDGSSQGSANTDRIGNQNISQDTGLDSITHPGDGSSQDRTKEEKKKKKHWPVVLAVCTALLLLGGGVFAYFNVHLWAGATCTTPKTCRICGKKDGATPAHHYEIVGCEMPLVCSICGETTSSTVSHKWSKATCTTPQTCRVCGAVGKPAAGHTWTAATCITPKTCSVCGATQGNLAEHHVRTRTLIDYFSCKRETEQFCSLCDKVLSSTSEDMTTLMDDSRSRFLITPFDFCQRLVYIAPEFNSLRNISFQTGTMPCDFPDDYTGTFVPPITVDIYDGSQKIGTFHFGTYHEDFATNWNDSFDNVTLTMDPDQASGVYYQLPMLLIAACDPTINPKDSFVLHFAQEAFTEGVITEYNELLYLHMGSFFQVYCDGALN